MSEQLPPMPDPEAWNTHHGAWGDRSTDYAYTMRQMQAYAMQAIKAEREACAALVQQNALACDAGSLLQVYLASNAAAIRARTPPRDGLTHQPGATMCKCTTPTLIRTEKHCDRIVSVYSDGRRVTNFLPCH